MGSCRLKIDFSEINKHVSFMKEQVSDVHSCQKTNFYLFCSFWYAQKQKCKHIFCWNRENHSGPVKHSKSIFFVFACYIFALYTVKNYSSSGVIPSRGLSLQISFVLDARWRDKLCPMFFIFFFGCVWLVYLVASKAKENCNFRWET